MKSFLGALLLLILISGYVFREKEVVQEEFNGYFCQYYAYGAILIFKGNVEAAFRKCGGLPLVNRTIFSGKHGK